MARIKQSLSQIATTEFDNNQIESMTCDYAFIFVHSENNQCYLEVNSNSCVLDLKYNLVTQHYAKLFDNYQSSVEKLNQSNSFFPIINRAQTITYTVTLKNTGTIAWPQSIQLVSSFNPNIRLKNISPIPSLSPNEQAIVKIEIKYKSTESTKSVLFRLATVKGDVFSSPIEIVPKVYDILSYSENSTLKIWDFSSQQLINTIELVEDVPLVIFRRECVLIGLKIGSIHVFDFATGTMDYTDFYKIHDCGISCLLALNDNTFVCGSADQTLQIWNFDTKQKLHTLQGHTDYVSCIAKLNDDTIVSSSWDKSIKLWNTVTGECVNTIETNHQSGIIMITVLPNKQYIVSGSYDNTVKVWNIQTKQCVITLRHSEKISSLCLVNENQLASVSNEKNIRIWNTNNWECETLIQNDCNVNSLLKLQEDCIASGDENGNIKIWNTKTNECICQWKAHSEPVTLLVMK